MPVHLRKLRWWRHLRAVSFCLLFAWASNIYSTKIGCNSRRVVPALILIQIAHPLLQVWSTRQAALIGCLTLNFIVHLMTTRFEPFVNLQIVHLRCNHLCVKKWTCPGANAMPCYIKIQHSDWLKIDTWLSMSNQSALFRLHKRFHDIVSWANAINKF